jgi:hypothetical protein
MLKNLITYKNILVKKIKSYIKSPNVSCSGKDLEENFRKILCLHVPIQKQGEKNGGKGQT